MDGLKVQTPAGAVWSRVAAVFLALAFAADVYDLYRATAVLNFLKAMDANGLPFTFYGHNGLVVFLALVALGAATVWCQEVCRQRRFVLRLGTDSLYRAQYFALAPLHPVAGLELLCELAAPRPTPCAVAPSASSPGATRW